MALEIYRLELLETIEVLLFGLYVWDTACLDHLLLVSDESEVGRPICCGHGR